MYDPNSLTLEQIDALEAELNERLTHWRFGEFFPDEGPHRRELYKKHLAFFDAGAKCRERLFMAGNRTGKSEAGAYECTVHATGRYPHWWTGRRFAPGPWEAWCAGSTIETTRDIVQAKLIGSVEKMGTGMIPYDDIVDYKKRQGSNDALDFILVKQQRGTAVSKIGFKSYDQGRKNFEGTAKQLIWLDEEPPQLVYTECLVRTTTTKGLIVVTFTPLNGATAVVMDFMNNAEVRA